MRRLFLILAVLAFSPVGAHAAAALSDAAWSDLMARAEAGDRRAQRKAAIALIEDAAPDRCAPRACEEKARALLISAARAGDNVALITLERMRTKAEPAAPRLDDIIAIEIARAERGDAMTAWRLARRYETGEGVKPSQLEMIRWLKVAASEDPGVFPYAKDAAFRLCEIYGQRDVAGGDWQEARDWCRHAAGAGHAGAAMVIARLRGADE